MRRLPINSGIYRRGHSEKGAARPRHGPRCGWQPDGNRHAETHSLRPARHVDVDFLPKSDPVSLLRARRAGRATAAVVQVGTLGTLTPFRTSARSRPAPQGRREAAGPRTPPRERSSPRAHALTLRGRRDRCIRQWRLLAGGLTGADWA